ncbi:Imm74 family immunity protein [Endomicrobium proavitum]|uniref:Uncharacterized protein n=1 Tax=Endomicrobium proavitum TaxID=1408281 RepID=A0A0G3WHT0_9BACT|nr:Imm74 family immunity protein [Endomicrobium proavitum]AKL98221.1 hypothetical protein Epro_0842 [Endomicrobium proavitum]
MGKFQVKIWGRAQGIEYITEDGKELLLYIELLPKATEVLSLRNVQTWNYPYEDEEISIEEKQTVLRNISEAMVDWGVKVDLSPESNIVHYDAILVQFESAYNATIDIGTFKMRKFSEMSDNYKNDITSNFLYWYREYCKLNNDEMKKFKEEIENNKNIQGVLSSFAKWKVSEDVGQINQKKFNYGLYALDILLLETNKEEIKEILKDYISVSKEKNLSFNEFMSKNRPLNAIINELLK